MTAPSFIERLRAELEVVANAAPLLHPDAPARPLRRRRLAHRLLAPAMVAAVGVAVVVLVAIVPGTKGSTIHVSTRPAPSASSRAEPVSDELAVLAGSVIEIVDVTDGRIVKTVDIQGSDGDDSHLTVSPGGATAYLQVNRTPCRESSVVAVDLRTGTQRLVVAHPLDPALSPDGHYLAYTAAVAPPERFGEPRSCATGPTSIENLATGSRRSWDVETHPSGDIAPLRVTGLVWGSNDRDLLLTTISGNQVDRLTTTAPLSKTNPALVTDPWVV